MDCPAEEQLVRMALSRLDGIDRVEVNLEQRDVLIEHSTDPAQLGSALRSLNLGTSHVDDTSEIGPSGSDRTERIALIFALVVNAGFFITELTVGILSRSMGLVADSLDMGADASVYALSLAAVGTAVARKQRLARTSAYLQFGLAALGLVEVGRRFFVESELPDTRTMITMSVLALVGNIVVLAVLHRVRTGEAHLEASWIFTANDIKVNLLVIAAAVGVALTSSGVPDLMAGAIIFAVVARGARRILAISR